MVENFPFIIFANLNLIIMKVIGFILAISGDKFTYDNPTKLVIKYKLYEGEKLDIILYTQPEGRLFIVPLWAL